MRWSQRLRLPVSDTAQVLMQDQDGVPRVMVAHVGDGAVVVLNFQMPPRAEAGLLVSLLHMLMDHVTPEGPRRDFTVGRAASISVRQEGRWTLQDPKKRSWPVTADGAAMQLPNTRETGWYALVSDEGVTLPVTFNADPAESDLRRTNDPVADHIFSKAGASASAAHGRDLWPVLMGLAFAMLMTEALLLFWWRR